MEDLPAYGETRERGANVSYADVERAALDILATGRRPAVETVREAIGRGSPATIATHLKRFWRDLGIRAQGDPAALTRLPSEIVEAVEAIWQRALGLAAQAAKHNDNAARERLERMRVENEVRARSFEMREKELETAGRERETALTESRSQVSTLMSELSSNRATMRAQVARIMDLGTQIEDYRRQLARLIERAVSRNRTLALAPRKLRPANRPKPQAKPKRRVTQKKPAGRRLAKHRAKS
jgi:Plasmid replication region DNA-binding N-term